MAYEFSIDKKTGIILVTGYALVGVLLFVAGFLLGIEYHFPSSPAELMARSSPVPPASEVRPATPATKQADQPVEGSASAGTAPQSILAPVLTPTPLNQEQAASTSPETPVPAGSAGNSSPAAPVPPKTPAMSPVAPPASATLPATPQAASSASGASEPLLNSPAPEEYSIQVGAFIDPGNALRLEKELQEKGYKAIVFNATDSHYRVWHAVRIGPFKDMQTAAKEAASFKKAEQLLALVRPAKSL